MGEEVCYEKLNPLRSIDGLRTSSHVLNRSFASLIEREDGRLNLCSLPLRSFTVSVLG